MLSGIVYRSESALSDAQLMVSEHWKRVLLIVFRTRRRWTAWQ